MNVDFIFTMMMVAGALLITGIILSMVRSNKRDKQAVREAAVYEYVLQLENRILRKLVAQSDEGAELLDEITAYMTDEKTRGVKKERKYPDVLVEINKSVTRWAEAKGIMLDEDVQK
jgi:hypothetical protein